MGWVQAVVEALKIFGLVLNWWKEKSDAKRKAKGEVLREVFKSEVAPDQDHMRKLINKFNSIR